MGLYTIYSCYCRAINVLQHRRVTVYQPEGLDAPVEPIPLRRNQAHTGHRLRVSVCVGGGGAYLHMAHHTVINPSSSNDRLALTPSHTKQSWSLHVKTARSYHGHGSPAHWSQMTAGLKKESMSLAAAGIQEKQSEAGVLW